MTKGEDESLFDAWESSKEFLRQFPHHGSPIFIQLETFCNVLTPSSWNILDAFLGGSLLSKSYTKGLFDWFLENCFFFSKTSKLKKLFSLCV